MKKIKSNKKYILITIILLTILLLCMVISATIGSANIGFRESLKIILSKIPLINTYININDISESAQLIITNIRLPRILLVVLVGIGLSICGATYQGTLKNIMADPYILGVSAGASLRCDN